MSKRLQVPNAWVVPPERDQAENQSREGETATTRAVPELPAQRAPEPVDATQSAGRGRRAKARTEPEMAFNFKLPVSLGRLVHEEALRRKTRRERHATIVGVFADLVRQHLSQRGSSD